MTKNLRWKCLTSYGLDTFTDYVLRKIENFLKVQIVCDDEMS